MMSNLSCISGTNKSIIATGQHFEAEEVEGDERKREKKEKSAELTGPKLSVIPEVIYCLIFILHLLDLELTTLNCQGQPRQVNEKKKNHDKKGEEIYWTVTGCQNSCILM